MKRRKLQCNFIYISWNQRERIYPISDELMEQQTKFRDVCFVDPNQLPTKLVQIIQNQATNLICDGCAQ